MLRFASLSAATLAHAFEQSTDCVKLVGRDGDVLWMNANGLCAMEIDDAGAVCGRAWDQLWPDDSRGLVVAALATASTGETVRFDAFCPTARGAPRWWNVTVSSVHDVDGAHAGYLAISRDVTAAETARQALLVASEELRHRLKNTYAMIGSLFSGFARGNPHAEAFARDMQRRLVALGTAQSLFAASDAPSDLAVLLPALVEPFSGPACAISTAGVASISVAQGEADALALVVGELAVNSTKYGALRCGGAIALETAVSEGEVLVRWHEHSAEPVAARSRPGGSGLSLIDRIVRIRAGSLDFAWQEHGVDVTVRFPRAGGIAGGSTI